MPQSEIIQSIPFAKIGFSKALQAGWIVIDKSNDIPIVKKKATSIIDIIQNNLKNLTSLTDQLRNDYKKRKLIQQV